MTTIAAIQGDGFAAITADTRISSFDDNGPAYHMGSLATGISKVSTNGNFLIGAAGDLRAINLLSHAFTPPPVPEKARGKKLDQFVTTKFIPALRNCFDIHGYSSPENKDNKRHNAEQDSTILLVVNATIYIIENDYSWMCDSSGLYAVGSGSEYALGALNALCGGKKVVSPIQAKAACLKAVSIAAKMDPHTGAPYHSYIQTAPDMNPAKRVPAAKKKSTAKKSR